MSVRSNRLVSALLGSLAIAVSFVGWCAEPARPLTAVVLYGSSSRLSAPVTSVPLVPGLRVQSAARSWSELAFSDGTSLVLEPGADFTLRGIERDRGGRLIIRGASDRGR